MATGGDGMRAVPNMLEVDVDIDLRERPRYVPAPKRVPSRLRSGLMSMDAVSMALAWLLTLLVEQEPLRGDATDSWRVVLLTGFGVGVVAGQGLYSTNMIAHRGSANRKLARAALASGAVSYFLMPFGSGLGRLFAPTLGALLILSLVMSSRFAFDQWLARQRSDGRYSRKIVVVGDAEETGAFLALLDRSPELGLDPVAVVGPDPLAETERVPWLGPVRNACAAAAATEATGAIVLVNGVPSKDVNVLVRDLVSAGVHVHLSNGMFGLGLDRLQPVPVAHEPFVYVRPKTQHRRQMVAKRVLDVTGAGIALLLTAPVLVAAAVAIKLFDRGPVLFRQLRVGKDGRRIVVHKLRTMVPDAESRLQDVLHLNERQGPLFKAESDPRVTRIGALLRAASIDELPQLFDVLRGDISLVGPRPALPSEVEKFDEQTRGRLRVKPGVTGLWQLEARDKPSFESYRQLDLFYVDNWTIRLDVCVLFSTIPVVITRALRAVFGRSERETDRGEPRRAIPETDLVARTVARQVATNST